MQTSAALAKALGRYGVETVFGVMGTGTLQLVHRMVHEQGIRYLATAREDGAISMADGMARATGRIGVAMVTYGPAFTNISHPLTEAVRNRTPLLVIAGDTPSHLSYHFQHVDHQAYAEPTGAGFMRVRQPNTVAEDLREAMRRAWVERRPVVLNIPVDYQSVEIDIDDAPDLVFERKLTVPDPEQLDLVAGLLANANRPLILAGRGAAESNAREALLRLGELLGAPFTTTVKGKGLFARSPFDLGIFGGMANEVGTKYIAESDCVITFGAGLNSHTTLDGELLAGKRVVQVDTDPESLGRFGPVDLELLADARLTADALVAMLEEAQLAPSPFRSAAMAQEIASYDPEAWFKPLSGEHGLDMRSVMIALDRLLPAERNLVTDVGHFLPAPLRYLDVPDHHSYFNAASFGSVGLGLSTATGVALARPEQVTVCVMGDGGLMMSLAEFNTAVRFGANLVAVVLNDHSYGQEWHHLEHQGLDADLSMFDWPDFAAVARAMGGRGLTVTDYGDLAELKNLLGAGMGPLLLDIHVDPRVQMGVTD